MSRLRRKIGDERVLSLIGKYLRAGVKLPNGRLEPTRTGVPQGGPLSPLLANILLDDLDQELEKRGHSFARYADDFVILCRSRRAAERVMGSVARFIEQRLKLVVNKTKSKVCEIKDAVFLGFTLVKNRIKWAKKSKTKFKARLREITSRTRGVSPWKVMEELQTYVRGAVNYYEPGITYREALELESWLRTRVRLYYWKQWGKPRTRRRNLLRLGIAREKVHLASRSRKGPWRLCHTTIVSAALNNDWLEQQGVPSIANQWINIALASARPFGLPLAGYLAPLGSVSERPCKGPLEESMTDGNRPVQPSAVRQTVRRTARRASEAQSNPHAGWCGGSGFNPRSYPIVPVGSPA